MKSIVLSAIRQHHLGGMASQRVAVGLMLVSALAYSVTPLALVLFGGVTSPFLYNACYRWGGFLAGTIFLCAGYRELLATRSFWRVLNCRLWRWDLLLVLAPYVSYTLFAWSAQFVDVGITVVLHEVWPLLFVVLLTAFWWREGRYQRLAARQLVLSFLAFVGVVFTLSSQEGGLVLLGWLSGDVVLGACLALGSAFLAGSTAYNYLWASDLRAALVGRGIVMAERNLELFALLVVFTLGSGVSALVNLGAGLLFESRSGVWLGNWWLVTGAVVVGGMMLDCWLGTVCNRVANLKAVSLSVNGVNYFIPLLALLWLWLVVGIGVERSDYFVVGSIAVLISNVLMNWRVR